MRNVLRAEGAESRIGRAVDRCQVLACEISGTPPTALIARIRLLANELPTDASPIELVALRNLLTRVLIEIARSLGSIERADVRGPFIAWMASSPMSTKWRDDFSQLLDAWSVAFAGGGNEFGRRLDWRLHKATRFLDQHFADSSLSLRDLAIVVQLSTCHTSRFLRRGTGSGFAEHVNKRRIAAAQQQLLTTLKSVKEIAFSVGYTDCSQLSRYFKRITGVTPRAYRSNSSARSRDESQ